MLDDWVDAVQDELGLEIDVDVSQVLDIAKVAAHSVQRPAAPVTTFLLGYAAAQQGGVDEIPDLSERLEALAERWHPERGQ